MHKEATKIFLKKTLKKERKRKEGRENGKRENVYCVTYNLIWTFKYFKWSLDSQILLLYIIYCHFIDTSQRWSSPLWFSEWPAPHIKSPYKLCIKYAWISYAYSSGSDRLKKKMMCKVCRNTRENDWFQRNL